MVRRILILPLWGLVALTLLAPASGQQAKKQPAKLRVLLPDEDATVKLDDRATEGTGTVRVLTTPPVEPGRPTTVTVTAVWEPNNYTKITRTRKVAVTAGKEVKVDLTEADPKNPDKFLIRYVPTPDKVVQAMCKLAGVKKGDVVYDLGCGDGRIVITAVTKFGAARGVGIDIDPERIKDSNANAKKAGVTDKVKFRKDDVLNLKGLGDATVVMMYMGEDVNLSMMPILKKTLKPGSRIVSHDFGMGDWKPKKHITVVDDDGDEHELYLWTIKK